MKFVYRGRYQGKQVEVVWDNGVLESDSRHLRLEIEAIAEDIESTGEGVGPPTGPFVTRDILKDPLGALFLIRDIVFRGDGEVETIEGEFPTIPYTEGLIF